MVTTRWDTRIAQLERKITSEGGGWKGGLNNREWAELERIREWRSVYIEGFKDGQRATPQPAAATRRAGGA